MSTTLVVLPPDVEAVPALADRVRANTYPGMLYQCVRCHQRGQLGDDGPPVTIQVHCYRGTLQMLVKFLHTTCGAGAIVLHDADPGFEVPAESEAYAVALLAYSPVSTEPWPAIAVELHASLLHASPAGQHGDVDLVATGLLSLGLQPVSNVAYPPQPPDRRWQVLLPGAGEPGSIRGPNGQVLFEPLANFPGLTAAWTAAAARRGGHCAVYHVARAGMRTNLTATANDAAAVQQLLTTAARDGRVVGVIATVRGPR